MRIKYFYLCYKSNDNFNTIPDQILINGIVQDEPGKTVNLVETKNNITIIWE